MNAVAGTPGAVSFTGVTDTVCHHLHIHVRRRRRLFIFLLIYLLYMLLASLAFPKMRKIAAYQNKGICM